MNGRECSGGVVAHVKLFSGRLEWLRALVFAVFVIADCLWVCSAACFVGDIHNFFPSSAPCATI